jgi:peptidoglycan/LPS O-acetylase OafA/YrhL
VTTAAPSTDPTRADRAAFTYRPGLDGVRALAVLAVIAYHNDYDWAVGGFLGVDAFFVLSGFLITTLLVLEYRRADSIGLVAFWGRRLRRLLPALLLVLLFCAVYAVAVVPPLERNTFRWDGIASLFYVANWRFIVSGQSYFEVFATPSPFRHLWSLAIEEQFYLVWPLVVLGCLRIRRGRVGVLAAVCVAGTLASVVAMSVLYTPGSPSRAYYGTDTRAHALLIGALLALLLLSPRVVRATARATTATVLQVAGALALVAVVWSWNVTDATASAYYGVGSFLYAVAVAVVIAAVVQVGGWTGRVLGIAPLRGVGQISYGLYLWHWPIIVWLTADRMGFGGPPLVAVRLAVTFAAAILSYRFVENPIRHGRWWPRRARRGRFVAPMAIAILAVVLVASSVGAAKPPAYLGGPVGPCPEPSAADADAAAARLYVGTTPTEAPPAAPAIAVIGDSAACSLGPALGALSAHGWTTRMGASIGCGEISEVVIASDDTPRVTSGTEGCKGIAADARRRALAGDVPVAVLLSTWERADLVDGGKTVAAGSATWKRLLTRRMDALVRRLQRERTRLLVALMPAPAPARLGPYSSKPTRGEARAFARMDRFWRTAAKRHPGTIGLVDLAHHVCPKGPPCPRIRDGFAPRAVDGYHYTPEGAGWVMRWLLPQILAAQRAVAPRA